MSASHAVRSLVFGLALVNCGAVLAADGEAPDIEFLEYLGMWEETDEEWLILDDAPLADEEERSDPESNDEASPEKHDDN